MSRSGSALIGLDPSANGQVTLVVAAADRTWSFDLPVLPMGWVDGILTPTG